MTGVPENFATIRHPRRDEDIFERHDLSILEEYVAEEFVEYRGTDVSSEGHEPCTRRAR